MRSAAGPRRDHHGRWGWVPVALGATIVVVALFSLAYSTLELILFVMESR